MAISLKHIVAVKKSQPQWAEAMDYLLLRNIPKQQRKVLNQCRHLWRTSREVADACGISIFCASTVLKDLHKLTLLDREQFIDSTGKYFRWKAKV